MNKTKPYFTIFNSFPLPVIILNSKMEIIHTGDKWHDEFNSLDDKTENFFEKYSHFPILLKNKIKNILQTNEDIIINDIKYITNHNSIKYINLTISTLKIENHEELILIYAKNNTAEVINNQKLIEAQELANLGYWDFNLITQKITWSSQMYKIFPEDPKLGEPSFEKHKDTIHPEDREYWQKTVETVMEDHKPYLMKFRVIHPNKTVWVEARGKILKDSNNNPISLQGTCQDITEKENKERDLVYLNEELKSFSYRVSHDLKSPLNSIQGLVNMANDINSENPKELLDIMNDINSLTFKLTETIDSIINSTKLNNIKEEYIIKDTNIFIGEILEKYKQFIKDNEVTISYQSEVESLYIPELKTSSILENLISNSVKYKCLNKESFIKIKITDDHKNYIFSVEDNGIGIDQENQEQMFKMFTRFNSNINGSGLGLYMVKKQLDKLQGNIQYKNTGDGSLFIFSIPKI